MLYTVQRQQERPMAVRLNIVMDDELYRRLKRELPPKRISRFINDAVRAHLHPDRSTLDAAYKAPRNLLGSARSGIGQRDSQDTTRDHHFERLLQRARRASRRPAAHQQRYLA